ncbi:hypothetical protein SAMN05720487_103142 [Fibrobacter sp. UWT2]|uniref:hypothetical protein n=1 Tax=Fibrobacter sp. UWT2 TaxID=1896224 RepID=UPI0009148CCB|nr:hypothetical protein [Fibrobacter sp. UWT2]SHK64458.1 hypothetical protein SAMN05720487_103142 [Fibrobacter sp. UWT2]
MKFIIAAIKQTLTNIWFYAFWGLVGFVIGGFVAYVIIEDNESEKETVKEIVAEVVGHCPDNYLIWEKRDYLMPLTTNRDGNSILIFEKHIRRGCRPFLTGSETPEMLRKLETDDPRIDSVYHTSITGSVNLTTQKVIVIDTSYWAKELPKCPADTSANTAKEAATPRVPK